MAAFAIQTQSLSKKYRDADQKAVDRIDLSIYPNEVYGLLGPNGAGKTTTISILCGLLNPSSGKVTYFENPDYPLQKKIGVVPQDIALFESLTGYENLQYFADMYGLPQKESRPKIKELLGAFGLLEKADQQLKKYSGGMKRRINLLAAVLHKPEILFLDEPTVGIDVQSKKVILSFLEKLNQNGTTIIYTSHYMEEAERICHRVGIIDEGQIIVEGSPKDLIQNYDSCHNLEDIFIHLTGKKLRD